MKRAIDVGPVGRVVAENIKRLRKARGWSLRFLSKAVAAAGRDLSSDAILRIEFGCEEKPGRQIRRVDVADLVALAAAFNVSPSSLLAGPSCSACFDAPPKGFACNDCGAQADRSSQP